MNWLTETFTLVGFVVLFSLLLFAALAAFGALAEWGTRRYLLARVNIDVLRQQFDRSAGFMRANKRLKDRLRQRTAEQILEKIQAPLTAAVDKMARDPQWAGTHSLEELPVWAADLIKAALYADNIIAQTEEM